MVKIKKNIKKVISICFFISILLYMFFIKNNNKFNTNQNQIEINISNSKEENQNKAINIEIEEWKCINIDEKKYIDIKINSDKCMKKIYNIIEVENNQSEEIDVTGENKTGNSFDISVEFKENNSYKLKFEMASGYQFIEEYTFNMNASVSDYSQGESVPWITTLNGVALDNWKMFYEENGKSYLIYGDYLPNTALSNTMKTKYNLAIKGNYDVYCISNRDYLINAMITREYWSDLLNGTLNGRNYNYTLDKNYIAKGSIDVEFYTKVWNEKYKEDKLYLQTNTIGYYVGNELNPSTYVAQKSNEDSLFYPHKEIIDNNTSYGYWLASRSADNLAYIMLINYDGKINRGGYNGTNRAFRPIISLPSEILKK